MAIGAPARTATVYLAPFHVLEPEDFREPARRTAVHDEFRAAVERGEWPYDPSEDPSFFCARRFRERGGALSWGICRPNLRDQLRVGDTVAFFAVSSRRRNAEYRFAGYATVAEKVGQDQIWQEERLAVYREYLNLLVEPLDDGSFIHRESHPGGGHPDWLWRMVGRTGYSWRARDFAPWEDQGFEKTIRLGVEKTADRQPIRFARNYVIFEREAPETVLLADPPLVATSPGGREPEAWVESPLARALRASTLGDSRRTLRTTAPRNQHPFVRLDMPAGGWRRDIADLVAATGLRTLS